MEAMTPNDGGAVENEIPRVRPDEHKTTKRPSPSVPLEAMAIAWDETDDEKVYRISKGLADTFFETYREHFDADYDFDRATVELVEAAKVTVEGVSNGLIPMNIASGLITFSALRSFLPGELEKLAEQARVRRLAFAEFQRIQAELQGHPQ